MNDEAFLLALAIKQSQFSHQGQSLVTSTFGNKVNAEVMKGQKMFRLCYIIFLSLALTDISEASQEEKNPSAVLVGSVYCDTCYQQSFTKASHFISGAVVAVECSENNTTPQFKKEVSTNEHGEFKAHLPFSINKDVKKIDRCSVKLIKSSEPLCAEASTSTSSELHLKSKQKDQHIFSAGFFTFKPLKQPKLCGRKPNIQESKASESQKSTSNPTTRYLQPIEDSATSNVPQVVKDQLTLPQLPPLPPLPPLPSLPGIPFFPLWPPISSPMRGTIEKPENPNEKATLTQFFGPNPFLPPSLFSPTIPPITTFPPIMTSPSTPTFPPIMTTPPASLFPPILPSPFTSPPTLLPPGNVPPAVPDTFSTPLPPPPPVFQSLPAFPFQPTTGFPGAPPTAVSISSKTTTP